ncbi:MAG TPA: TonB-dependent receptor [Candidatus Eisenbacteria bacterium]|nr:TonB-dependent receptor [Candidatus Eisenbacteria bacterium]
MAVPVHLLVLGLALPADSLAAPGPVPVDTVAAVADTAAAADTAATRRRVVREFPAIEVRALLHDLRSSETVHEIPTAPLRAYPVDRLAELVALQPGVVAQAGELHVRGGRAGETRVMLEGLLLNEPLRHRPMELPMLALSGAELVSGAPESRYPGALAGVLDLASVEPGARTEGEARWQTDAGLDTRFDRLSGRVSAPLPGRRLGVVAAADVTLDDTWLPALRSNGRRSILGVPVGWRADNRLLGWLKLAPVGHAPRFAAQVAASRTVRKPYDAAWTRDGWSALDGLGFPVYSDTAQPGLDRYRAADHLPTIDERRLATVLTASAVRGVSRGTLGLGWLRTRSASTVGGAHAIPSDPISAQWEVGSSPDPFHVIFGDYPLYQVSGSDVLSLRGDAETVTRGGVGVGFGAGVSYEDVWLDELDATLLGQSGNPIDSVRTYHAYAPGGHVYAQGRWQSGGLVMNGGLRVEYWSAGRAAERQTLPGSARGRIAFLPRVGIAYPISTRDVLSMAYTRVDQTPERDLLYDRRTRITNRQPLGNPAIQPATMISYEAAVKHLINATWALQTSFFYRDVARLAGARDYQTPGGNLDLRYTDEDQASAAGFEMSLVHAPGDTRRLEAHYTFMHAWGYESRPEGDPYGPVLEAGIAPFTELPVSWDRRHALVLAGLWSWKRWTVAGSSEVASPFPWTPKPRRQQLADLTLVNSRRFGWSAIADLAVTWSPPYALGLTFGLDVRNLFNDRAERSTTTDGYPNPVVNTVYDDYGAYRTETGLSGGAYWTPAGWVPVHDARLFEPPRTVRASVGRRW